MPLPTFEKYAGRTKRAKQWIEWLLQEIHRHDLEKPITAKVITARTTREKYMTEEQISDRETYTIKPGVRNAALKAIKRGEGLMEIGADPTKHQSEGEPTPRMILEGGVLKHLVKIEGLSDVEVRGIVNYLRGEHRYPIGSCGKGYYWIRTTEGKDVTTSHLKGRISAAQFALDGVENADYSAPISNHLDLSEPGLFDDFYRGSETPWGAADEHKAEKEIPAPELVIGTDAILAELDKIPEPEKEKE